jgi:hypothetical protein
MRRITLLLFAMPAAAALAQPLAPKALADGFSPGRWTANEVSTGARASRTLCISSVAQLATNGRPAGGCQMKLLNDAPNDAVILYTCESGLSGRTEIRRDAAGIYTVHSQGVDGGKPFASHAEWRRAGVC